MKQAQTARFPYGSEALELRLPASAAVLEPQSPPALSDASSAVEAALANPIGSPPLAELLERKKPQTVAVTISDITRPVPNTVFLPGILRTLHRAGVADGQIVLIIGTGMHRPSTPRERRILLGALARRFEVVDHAASDADSLVRIEGEPPVRVNRRFVEADFRIVTGFIEPHFMAGFSGGRKGVCPALVDLETIQRFHGFQTLADPRADSGVLKGNPCHEISLAVARRVGVDFLFNVAITRDRRIAGIYCGDLERAHEAGCRQVARWTAVEVPAPFDLVVTSGGGFPLDQTFYQAVKGLCGVLPALGRQSTLLEVARCQEGLGSRAYADLLLRYGKDWLRFLADLAANPEATALDQWEFQMHCRVLERIGVERLRLVSDGLPADVQERIAVTPVGGPGAAAERAQGFIDAFLLTRPDASVAAIPDGPYAMLRKSDESKKPRGKSP